MQANKTKPLQPLVVHLLSYHVLIWLTSHSIISFPLSRFCYWSIDWEHIDTRHLAIYAPPKTLWNRSWWSTCESLSRHDWYISYPQKQPFYNMWLFRSSERFESPWLISTSWTHLLKPLYGTLTKKLFMLLSGSPWCWGYSVWYPLYSSRRGPLWTEGDINEKDSIVSSRVLKIPTKIL